MSGVVLTLDGFVFKDFEVPEAISFGGSQSLSIKRLIGGERVIDAMGSDDRPLEWSGRFRGSDAVSRALQLDAKRRAGRAVSLTWGELSFQVIVARFEPVYQQAFEVPYSISCEIVPAPLASSVNADVGVDQMVKGDLDKITALAARISTAAMDVRTVLIRVNNLITLPGRALSDLVGAFSDAIGLVPNFAASTRASLAPVFTALTSLREGVGGYLEAADETLGPTLNIGGIDPGAPAAQLVPALLAQASAMSQASDLQDLDSYLGRIQTNLDAIGASGSRVLMAGGDLYRVAADTYGSAAEWVSIARVNGLTDPEIQGFQTILVPPTPSKRDGVLDEVLDASPGAVDVSLAATVGGFGELDFSNPDDAIFIAGL